MIKRKTSRDKGKIKFSRYFQNFDSGEKVAVIMELSTQPKFPRKLQGRSGIVIGSRGGSYLVKINDLAKEKTYIIHPVHLKKIAQGADIK